MSDINQTIKQLKRMVEAMLEEQPTNQQGEPTMAMKKSKEQNAILKTLAELTAGQFNHDTGIVREGTKLVLPNTWSVRKGIETLSAYQQAMEAETSFTRRYKYRPWDGAAAFERAVTRLTGTTGIGQVTMSFFGSRPPARHTIQIGVNETLDVPWDRIAIPLFDTTDVGCVATLQGTHDEELGSLFVLTVNAAKQFEGEINAFFDIIQDELDQRSIYRGKAITGADMPEFIDLSGVDPSKVIYSDDVMAQMNAHVWGILKYADAMRAEGISLKRSVLFHGPYGTGKTLGGMLTAQEAIANGFTFIMCRPGKDNPFDVLQTAQLYAPSVVFIEDIDTYSRSQGMGLDQMSQLLDKFDGIEAKGHEILNVMTTNHEESITKGMLRPGRLDALIEISHLDRGGVERMVLSKVEPDMLDAIDFDLVYDACEGYLPAFVAETVDRAKNASIVRGEGVLLPLTTADLRNGAMSLRPQFNLMEKATEVEVPPVLDGVLRGIMRDAVTGMEVVDDDVTMVIQQ